MVAATHNPEGVRRGPCRPWSISQVGKPGRRGYKQRGGRPSLNVDFVAVCDAVLGAWSGSGETITEIAARFGVSRGWIHKWVSPALESGKERR